MNIILTGFMGTGKTTVGRRVADLLKVPFFDVDETIKRQSGRTIAELFKTKGEAAFRVLESTTIQDLSMQEKAVIATGGGSLMNPLNREFLEKRGILVCLTARKGTLLERLKDDLTRPLLAGENTQDRIDRLLQERQSVYAMCPVQVETDEKTIEQVAAEVIEKVSPRLEVMTMNIHAKAGSASYDIVIGKPLTQFPSTFSRLAPKGTKVGLLCDASVERRYGTGLLKALKRAGYEAHLLSIPSGEHSKSLRQAERVYSFCARGRLERKSWLIALGGGVVGDLAGFVAATYLRGIPFVQIPTTLLAQVDSSIGGKTGVDIPQGKNLAGSFYQPRLVWIDPHLLNSLPQEHWRNGLGEVIKYGAILDARLFAALEKKAEGLRKGYSSAWLPIIARCAELKARVVEKDPHETRGLRAILNFGHSVGHAIEAATGFRGYLHGEAISIGMFVAAIISQQHGGLDAVDRIRLGTLLTKAGLPLRVRSKIPRAKLMEFLARDKKVADGAVRFVLLDGIGRAKPGQTVTPEVLDVALSTVGL